MMFGLDTLHEKGWFKSLAAMVGLMVGVVALVSGLTTLMHRNSVPSVQPPDSALLSKLPAETSQALAVTAPAAVEVTDGPRTLTEAVKQELLQTLKDRDATITVMCVRQDAEAAKYAREILDYLISQHYRTGLAYVNFPPSFRGLDIDRQQRHVFIKIGPR